MMNKNKSGIPARFKAALVAPFAILLFFLFADFTLKGSSVQNDPLGELEGLWIKQSDDDFSEKLFIKDGSFSYIDGDEILHYNALLQNGVILLKGMGIQWPIRYKLSENVLSFSWDRNTTSRYIKSQAKNTLDQLLSEKHMKIDLPYISRYRLMEKEDLIYRIGIGKEKDGTIFYKFNGESISVEELSGLVKKKKERLSVPDKSKLTGIFYVDRKVPMSEVDKVRLELRKNSLYRVAVGGYPKSDLELSPLLYHTVALPRRLPPMDAQKLENQNEWVKGATVTAKAPPRTESKSLKDSTPIVYTIDLSARNLNPRDIHQNLEQVIRSSGEAGYILSLEYDKDIPYGQYVVIVDMIYNVVYSFRFALAQEKYGASYDKLGDELQNEIRKAYPIALSENLKEGQN